MCRQKVCRKYFQHTNFCLKYPNKQFFFSFLIEWFFEFLLFSLFLWQFYFLFFRFQCACLLSYSASYFSVVEYLTRPTPSLSPIKMALNTWIFMSVPAMMFGILIIQISVVLDFLNIEFSTQQYRYVWFIDYFVVENFQRLQSLKMSFCCVI